MLHSKATLTTALGNSIWYSWWWGEITSLNCEHERAYCSCPRTYMSMETYGGMILTGKNLLIHPPELS